MSLSAGCRPQSASSGRAASGLAGSGRAIEKKGETAASRAENENGNARQTGNAHEHQEDGSHGKRFWPRENLAEHFVAEIIFAAGAGDDQTARH